MDLALERLQNTLKRINKAAKEVNREFRDVKLIAVSKTHGVDAIEEVIKGGHLRFGENRVQEAQSKWPELKERFDNLELHLIGPLQSNKAKDAVALFDVIHSIDRSKIADSIADEIAKQGKKPKLFVQVNTGEEPQKAGVLPGDVEEFVGYCQESCKLNIAGLMCIPPFDDEPSLHFALLAKKAKALGLQDLSMGMSKDFEAAIQLGATYVRVGTALFGDRG
ncbi:MAG: YggS family pyridoxal phosphate-dependent enzyme [Methyloligellaceae bacterium]